MDHGIEINKKNEGWEYLISFAAILTPFMTIYLVETSPDHSAVYQLPMDSPSTHNISTVSRPEIS
jgi:hypothetical protein